MKIQILVFMSEIKFDLTRKKIKFSVCFMLLYTLIKLLPALRFSHQKTFFLAISFEFGLVQWGIILGENTVLHLENEPE